MIVSSPPIGAIAYGESGQACTVTDIDDDRVLLICPSGIVRVPITAIVRWELPPTQANRESVSAIAPQTVLPTHKPMQQGAPLNPYREYPGSIATPVDKRLLEVFATTPERWWTPAQLAKLPCMGGPTIEQLKKNLKLLVAHGLVERDGDDRKALYKQTRIH